MYVQALGCSVQACQAKSQESPIGKIGLILVSGPLGVVFGKSLVNFNPFFSLKKEGIDFSSSNDPTAKKRVAATLPKDPNVAASQQVCTLTKLNRFPHSI